MSRRVDTAIIGGGLVGLSAALALRAAGQSVAVFDRGFCGAQASGVNFGGVRRQGRPMEQLPMAARAHGIWPRLKALIGIDGEYVRSGHLKLACSEADAASLEDYAARAAGQGLKLDMLGSAALRQRFGFLSNRVVAGSWAGEDGQANPRLVAAGFAAAARRAGVMVCEHQPVLHAMRDGGGFALETSAGAMRAGALVNTAGAWAGPFAAAFGEAVPLAPIYPSIVVSEPLPPFIGVNIGMEGGMIYARQVARGNVVAGGERGEPLADADFSRPTADGALAIMARAVELFPLLAGRHVIRTWSGTEGAMPDRNPVIGPSLTTPGLLHGFGFSGAGFQLAPAVGDVLAELVLTGATSTPIEAFSIRRFTRHPQPAPAGH